MITLIKSRKVRSEEGQYLLLQRAKYPPEYDSIQLTEVPVSEACKSEAELELLLDQP